jgi:hypothetical protein
MGGVMIHEPARCLRSHVWHALAADGGGGVWGYVLFQMHELEADERPVYYGRGTGGTQ